MYSPQIALTTRGSGGFADGYRARGMLFNFLFFNFPGNGIVMAAYGRLGWVRD